MSSRVHFPWLLRALLVLGIVVVVVSALGSSRPAAEAPATPTSAAAPPTELPTLVPTPRPTATREVEVERIISRISRATPAPYPTSTPRPEGQQYVSVVDFAYMPSVLRIRVGQTVLWRNDGLELHDITGEDGWHSGAMEPFIEYRHVFGFEGSFKYQCSVHLDMRGTIIVEP
jgi:plastocyanin